MKVWIDLAKRERKEQPERRIRPLRQPKEMPLPTPKEVPDKEPVRVPA